MQQSFIGIVVAKGDYSKVKGLLAVPSYKDTLLSYQGQRLILIYAIEGFITSPSQYRWISNIKLGLQKFLFVPFDFVNEFYIADTTVITNTVYTISELSQAFNAPKIMYPKIMYPPTKKLLYRHLCWYGARLIHKQVFTHEALVSAALFMNKKLTDKHSNKDLHKKTLGAYMWLVKNIDGFKVGLTPEKLKAAHSKGALTKNSNQSLSTKQLIDQALATGDYTKANGKPNKAKLAKALNLHRNTIARHLT